MKLVIVGGGSYYLLPVLRGLLGDGRILAGGTIDLYDICSERAATMGRMAMKTPEYKTGDCRISWSPGFDESLAGADVVMVILMGSSQESHARGMVASAEHNFIGSDNVSPNGAFLAVKTAHILFHLATRMAACCPRALLVNFANPASVLSGMVNNHTPIRTAGVCAGATNHQWDLSRLLGRDQQDPRFEVDVAGINHMSFILKGTYLGEPLFTLLDRVLTPDWAPPPLPSCKTEGSKKALGLHLKKMVEIYRNLGALIFSTETDGFAHLFYEEALEWGQDGRRALLALPHAERVRSRMRITPEGRKQSIESFERHLQAELNDDFWAHYGEQDGRFGRDDHHIMRQLLRGLGGVEKTKVVVSRLNEGAVDGFKARTVLEYSCIANREGLQPAGHYSIPDSVHGITSALATHQTLLGDAIAEQDPRKLAQALLAYPVRPYSRALRDLCLELADINRDEMPEPLRAVKEYL